MNLDSEDSLAPARASNGSIGPVLACLTEACRRAAHPVDDDRIERLLELACEAVGSERAFLVSAGSDREEPFSVRSVRSNRDDACRDPSRTALRQALATPGTSVELDASSIMASGGGSVRSLRLRTILSVPLPLPPPRTALVLDSRSPPCVPRAGLEALLDAFAALVALALDRPAATRATLSDDPEAMDADVRLDGRSAAYRRMFDWVRRIAPSSSPVLVHGESGTGKEGISRAIHRLSPRSAEPFVALNCSALSSSLLEAELFGAVRGAYTGADRDRPGLFRLAHGGTLFLDEIGDMPREMQAKLLRVIEDGRVRPVGGRDEHPVDVRVVAATHQDLARHVARGSFRADLFYRVSVLQVEVPPLRFRLEELPLLVEQLASRLAREIGSGPARLTPEAWDALRSHRWPGNIRELHAVLAGATLRAGGEPIRALHLDPVRAPAGRADDAAADGGLERAMIETTLHAEGGNVTAAASRIGWSRQKLYRRMAVFGIDR